MVAAEAAACGVLPISAAHSGLAEVSDALAGKCHPRPRGGSPSPSIRTRCADLPTAVTGWLEAGEEVRSQTRAGLVATVRERWSWDGVARGVIAAARGELHGLLPPRVMRRADRRAGEAHGAYRDLTERPLRH